MKKIIAAFALILAPSVVFAEQGNMVIGTTETPASHSTNYNTIQSNFDELYGKLVQGLLTSDTPRFAGVNLGTASTTTGLLSFYGNAKAFPFGLFSQGADSPGIGWRFPSTMPAGTYLTTVDTNGYIAYLDPATFAAALTSDQNYVTDAQVTILGDTDLSDLVDGSLTGTKVGFADTDNLFTASNIQAAVEEFNDSINSGVPNNTGAKVHWSQILGMPAVFADGTDDGTGGGITHAASDGTYYASKDGAWASLTGLYLAAGGTAANSSQLESHAASYFQVALTNPIVAAGAQSITGAKTFDPSMLLMKGTSTGVTTFATANTGASNYTVTFPAATGTVALTSNIVAPLSTVRTTAGGGSTTAASQEAAIGDALALKANATGISFLASALSDMKIIDATEAVTGRQLVLDTLLYNANADDALHVWSIDKVGSELAGKQASDSDLTALAALTTTATGLSILDDTTTGAMLTTLGLTANGQSLVTAANYADMRTLLDLEVGTDFDAYGTIPSGASPTVDAAGEVAVDTTSDQFIYYGGAKRVLTYKKQIDFAVKTPVDADDFILFKAQTAMTITDIHVIAQGGTSISVDIQECTSAGASCATVDAAITADTDGAEDDGTLSNGAIDAGDWVKVVLGAPSGTVNYLAGSIYYMETAN